MKIEIKAYKFEKKILNNYEDVMSEIKNSKEYNRFEMKLTEEEYKFIENTYLLKENYKLLYKNYENTGERLVCGVYAKNDKIITIYYYE